MYVAIVFGGIIGGGAQAAISSLIANAAKAHQQGATMGSVAALNSLMAVLAPMVATPLLGMVSHLDPLDWQMGLPFFFCAALQAVGAVIAVRYFRQRERLATAPA